MRIAAIIAEYGPFHNGHAYHIARTRENCDAVVCIMDGHISRRVIPYISGETKQTA